MTKINPVEQYFLQKSSEVNYGLWNAILTINGILISAFSLAIAFSTKINITLSGILVSFCCISMLLILWNYFSTKNHYLKIGRRFGDPNFELTEKEKQSDIASSIRRHKFNIYRENIAFVFMLVEITLVILIACCGKNPT